jgi:hypothetical protein
MKKDKLFKVALFDAGITALIIFIFLIIRAKIRGEGSVVFNINDPLTWKAIVEYLPLYGTISFVVFILIFLYEYFTGKRVWKRKLP